MIPEPGRLVLLLGLSQLICWGISYYLIGVFGQPMADELGWSLTQVYAGYSLALVTMGLVSARIGRLIDQHGGAPAMSAGSVLLAVGCGLLAVNQGGPTYWLAWIVLGLAMRCSLYDAAFAALARLLGPAARAPIARITLLGGLASTVFWPLGQGLSDWLGWRAALAVYALIGLSTLLLHRRIPAARWQAGAEVAPTAPTAPTATPALSRSVASSTTALGVRAWLFALLCALVGFTNAAMSSQQIVLLIGLGLGTATAVWVASLRGLAQTVARLLDILFGRKLAPLDLNLLAALICLLGFAIAPFIGGNVWAATVFSFLFGAGNGLLTITRGTVPLQLFDPGQYGTIVGRLIAPGFYLAAAAPVVLAWLIETRGPVSGAGLLLLLSMALTITSLLLRRLGPRSMRQ